MYHTLNRLNLSPHSISLYMIEDHGGCVEAHGMTSRKDGRRRKERQLEARRREEEGEGGGGGTRGCRFSCIN